MISQPLEFVGDTQVMERRYRRSPKRLEALAYQCAHVRDGLALDAVVVADDVGDRWVGAGDRALCRMLAKSAQQLSHRESQGAEYRMKALKSLRGDLTDAQLSTCTIKVPGRNRRVYVAGIGENVLRNTGVMTTAQGTQRILGFDHRAPLGAPSREDADALLQTICDRSYDRLLEAGSLVGPPPRRVFGRSDDGVYRGVVRHILAPVFDAVARSGVVATDPWRSLTFRSRESRHADGGFVRTLVSSLREARTGMRLGELHVAVHHRHDYFDLPRAPQLTVRWR